MIVRFACRYQTDADARGRLPVRVGVAFQFNESLSARDHDPLAAFEDELEAGARLQLGAALTIVITTPTFREFVLHAPSAERIADFHADLRAKHPTMDVQMYAAEDPDGDVYLGLTGA